MVYSTEEFERRIDSELAALDSIRTDDNKQHRCSVISEDLLEFSENLIDCDAVDDDDDSEDNSTPVNTPSPHVPVIEQATRKVGATGNSSRLEIIESISSEASRNGSSSLYQRTKQQQSEQKQQAKSDKSETMTRTSDHVSCEDLLEFACDGPNSRRTRGPRNGEQSDEVNFWNIVFFMNFSLR